MASDLANTKRELAQAAVDKAAVDQAAVGTEPKIDL